MAHDRLRRALEENNSAVDANALPVNGSLFASSDCILLYSKGFTFETNNVSFDVLNDTKMTYTVSSECQNTSDRYVCNYCMLIFWEDIQIMHRTIV